MIPTEITGKRYALHPGGEQAVQVYLTIRQRAWMRVIVDGEIQFDGRVLPGSAYPFVGDTQVEVPDRQWRRYCRSSSTAPTLA